MRQAGLLLVAVLAASSLRAQERVLEVQQYAAELSRLQRALGEGRLEEARAAARELRSARVALGSETVATDAPLLDDVEAAQDRGQAASAAWRIAVVLTGLTSGSAGGGQGPDRALLERLRAEETPEALAKGGRVGRLELKPVSFPERLLAHLRSAGEWLGRVWRKLAKLLLELWPKAPPPGPEVSSFSLNLGVLALVATITAVLGVLAYRALRRGQASSASDSQPLACSSRDDNPLTREADDWERYAGELAAGGRRREAIRAFYHAVLMALFRSGTVHYQKSRTNWEYASEIPPEAPFRRSFLELTRIFDREWYGHDTSAAEVLARCAAEARGILKSVREVGELA